MVNAEVEIGRTGRILPTPIKLAVA